MVASVTMPNNWAKWMRENKMKRYFFSVIEEMVLNPDFAGYRAGRIEVTDNLSKSAYPVVYEARFLVPEEFYEGFRAVFDFKESDLMPRITWEAN